jgi:putative ABC transport system substrate-binding protein
MRYSKYLSIILAVVLIPAILFINFKNSSNLPIIAIANYGPHASLDATIAGIKQELATQGFIEGKTVQYIIQDVGFDTALIPQMIMHLKNLQPKVMVVLTTPVAQYAKSTIKDIPLIYSDITDPVAAGLIKDAQHADGNMTGSSEQQDLKLVLDFAKLFIPHAKRVGMLYSTAESNDQALLSMMEQAATAEHMQVFSVPVDQARDVPLRMQTFKDKVDFIYVGMSGPIQPTLAVISGIAIQLGILVINADSDGVKSGVVLASFGINYHQVGVNTGKLVAQVLKGIPIANIKPTAPNKHDHHGFISKAKAASMGLHLPKNLTNITLVD